jgi:16S rRNA (cytosine1402-N4)-methyltransferase
VPTFTIINKRPITADDSEIAANPRARSAKLRGAERTDAPARDDGDEGGSHTLPTLDAAAGGA